MINMHNYDIKEKIVRNGGSEVFQNWHSKGVSMEQFLEGLKWVCEDPEKDFGDGIMRLTRELGCKPNGELVKLRRVCDKNGNFYGFYEIKTNWIWRYKVSINCRDRI